jgi:hypothetical protein
LNYKQREDGKCRANNCQPNVAPLEHHNTFAQEQMYPISKDYEYGGLLGIQGANAKKGHGV